MVKVSLARFNGRSSYWRKVRFVPERDSEKSGFQSKKSDVEILLGETSNGTACTVKKEPMVVGEGSGYTRNQVKSIQGQALGENALQGQSCEKVAILISTEQWETIDELVEFTAGKENFLTRVSELTLLNHDRVQKPSNTNKNVIEVVVMSVSYDSSSESSLIIDRKNTPFTGGKPMDSVEAFKAVFNDKFNGVGDPTVEEGRCVGESDILGNREAEIENNDEMEGVTNDSMLDLSELRWVDCVKKGKKYGSLLSFQDKVLSSFRKKEKG
ncbi:hypothetical protein V6N13_047427 [Hibiscus sabdariffa]